jgi:S-adenosylmethionine:tRNA ribosyltransferase-isomerase
MGPQDFDFLLPEELIAQYPLEERDASRLLVLSKDTGKVEHSRFLDLHTYLRPGDLLILNDTKVMAARLFGTKESGGAVELLLIKKIEEESQDITEDGRVSSVWLSMVRSSKALKPGAKVSFDGGIKATIIDREGEYYRLSLSCPIKDGERVEDLLDRVAFMPLPPYIKREAETEGKGETKPETRVDDKLRYQTIYARETGAVAAPTAGLHFTPEVFSLLKAKGVEVEYITLHTGPGTFKPVRAKELSEHKMHSEEYSISEAVFSKVIKAKKEGRRVIAVGSTSMRTLESAVSGGSSIDEPTLTGQTDIFIYPGYSFKIVDAVVTNFHLPRSTLIMLVSAFSSKEMIFKAYEEAIKERYRFFSYGDCMLIK